LSGEAASAPRCGPAAFRASHAEREASPSRAARLVNKSRAWFPAQQKMQASAENIWPAAQRLLPTMLNPDLYNLGSHPIRAGGLEEETIPLEVANDFVEVWLKDNYLGLIRDVLAQTTGQSLKIKFVVNPGAPASTLLNGHAAPASAPEPKAKGKAA